MGKASRDKGRRGQQEAQAILKDRDWVIAETNAGNATEDFIGFDPLGQAWAIEVKNTVSITTAHRQQAIDQAAKRKLPWMLMSKIAGTSSWLIQRKGLKPAVWSLKDD